MYSPSRQYWVLLSGFFFAIGLAWLYWLPVTPVQPDLLPTQLPQLQVGGVARMDSPLFAYSPGWQISEQGADPTEPADPLTMPSGVITFAYQGRELALQLAMGNYWGFLYVTVDGAPANLLPNLAGNVDSQASAVGYQLLNKPEAQSESGPTPIWVRVHRAERSDAPHLARIELWRSWGQIPIRAVAVDTLPPLPWPRWPAIALFIGATWLLFVGHNSGVTTGWSRSRSRIGDSSALHAILGQKTLTSASSVEPSHRSCDLRVAAFFSFALVVAGVVLQSWPMGLIGIGLLFVVGIIQPTYWLAALLFALPFYFRFTLPLLPSRSFGIMDVGVFGGCVMLFCHRVLMGIKEQDHSRMATPDSPPHPLTPSPLLLLWFIISWALISTFAAEHLEVALREWRTVFLAAGLFASMLAFTIRSVNNQQSTTRPSLLAPRSLLLYAWLAGGTAVALCGLWGYAVGYESLLSRAEGVTRLQAFYGSANNLALYLDRTVAVGLALMLFSIDARQRWLSTLLTVPQILAFLLTFSKGGIFLGLPMMLLVLTVGGAYLLWQSGRTLRPLWGLAAVVLLVVCFLIPVMGAERLRGVFDLHQGTSLIRLHLWRSAWQMALDHPLLGVGPDNFLYAFRSGYMLPVGWQEPNLNHPHNWLLDWWTRLGVPGVVLGGMWWGSMVWQLGKKLYRKRLGDWEIKQSSNLLISQSPLSLGLLTAVLASLAHGLIDVSYALPDLMIVWALIGVLSTTPESGDR